jgi:hypothetical protein
MLEKAVHGLFQHAKQKMTFYFASFEKWRCFLHRTQGVFQHPANVTDMQTVSVWG